MKDIVQEVKSILEHTLPKSITMQVSAVPDLWPVVGDATQLTQVLMNLCVNARMPCLAAAPSPSERRTGSSTSGICADTPKAARARTWFWRSWTRGQELTPA